MLGSLDRADYDRHVSQARAALGEDAFAAAWAAGRALSTEAAVAEALAAPAMAPVTSGPTTGTPAVTMAAPLTDVRLSMREQEVLRLLAAGKSNAEIADTLIISHHTVIRHVDHILTKLGVSNRTEAARHAAPVRPAPEPTG